ncbi:paired amphipathic helix protein Sin3-like 6 [Trifolium pratense]|uniref:paired amphipathic helix protein Sin3-like 6 n=1 Tax=Trifolium pratense TaxID=57577 RepID=UPI001E691C93|nr:paired amphipathic helix protein Sin3-like 6 [Trifolium pratense]
MMDLNDAMQFVYKVKSRFQLTRDRHFYARFLDIFIKYRNGENTAADVYREVTLILEGHDDLIDELRMFLPYTANVV